MNSVGTRVRSLVMNKRGRQSQAKPAVVCPESELYRAASLPTQQEDKTGDVWPFLDKGALRDK
jgi:hypothetical protein